jgi:hypothetical protein
MCLGGHLVGYLLPPLLKPKKHTRLNVTPTPIQAFRAAFDPRVLSAVCFFATDIHSATLGKGGDDSLERVRAGALSHAELVMIFGKQVRTHYISICFSFAVTQKNSHRTRMSPAQAAISSARPSKTPT